jgi:hydroxymethylbilane synthase
VSVLRLGTRGSVLARTQTDRVAAALAARGIATEPVIIRTAGDDHVGPLTALPAPGAFVSALRDELLAGRIDAAVHSAKDLPSAPVDGIRIVAVPVREDPRDAIVTHDGRPIDALAPGARVGTGSPRRAAALAALRPDLTVVATRGNVDTRLGRVASGELDALVVALAALNRLGRADEASEVLEPARMLPAPAQGAIAVECRTDDEATVHALATIDDASSHLTLLAERAVLAGLGASCASAVAALAHLEGSALVVTAAAAAPDGRHVRVERSAALRPDPTDARADAVALGTAAAEDLRAVGADALLVR